MSAARDIAKEFGALVSPARVHRKFPMSSLTTLGLGGTADWFVDARGEREFADVLCAARSLGLQTTILGGGSNVLVSDEGIRGLVVRNRHGSVQRLASGGVRAAAGVTLNGLIRWMIQRRLGGLESWAGTPGSVGGAIYGNAHFQGQLISERVMSIGLVSNEGREISVSRAEMRFQYDSSRLHRTKETVTWAEFAANDAHPEGLRTTARASLAYRKKTQPLDVSSAGCAFRNPVECADRLPPGLPCSAGALIDSVGLKGRKCGGARVSSRHGNFIVTEEGATASDVLALMRLCRDEVAQRYRIELVPEIDLLGEFDEVL